MEKRNELKKRISNATCFVISQFFGIIFIVLLWMGDECIILRKIYYQNMWFLYAR